VGFSLRRCYCGSTIDRGARATRSCFASGEADRKRSRLLYVPRFPLLQIVLHELRLHVSHGDHKSSSSSDDIRATPPCRFCEDQAKKVKKEREISRKSTLHENSQSVARSATPQCRSGAPLLISTRKIAIKRQRNGRQDGRHSEFRRCASFAYCDLPA